MNEIVATLLTLGIFSAAAFGQERDARIADLEQRLSEAKNGVAALQKTIEGLTAEVKALRQGAIASPPVPASSSSAAPAKDAASDYKEQILQPDLGGDERDYALSARPELFVQSRYQALPISGATLLTAPSNFELPRMESRWSGKISDKIGMGFEIEYQVAPQGSPEQLVNDAFVEYYASDALTFRVGQFVKPFGFDIQQSSSVRESPERGIFAGYFFPGVRDRGAMVSA
jgi:hypothetical protein